MKQSHLICALTIVVFTFINTSANAALIGVLPATVGGTDYQAYYDNVADLTWMADLSAIANSPYDDNTSQVPGRVRQLTAENWAANLTVNGVTGWRLPASDACTGFNCTGSELGNMYYNVLGGLAGFPLHSLHNSNYDLFTNFDVGYWTSTSAGTGRVYTFLIDIGFQSATDITGVGGGWAVYDGNAGLAAVPIPPAFYLFGSGLLGLVGMARCKKAA